MASPMATIFIHVHSCCTPPVRADQRYGHTTLPFHNAARVSSGQARLLSHPTLPNWAWVVRWYILRLGLNLTFTEYLGQELG